MTPIVRDVIPSLEGRTVRAVPATAVGKLVDPFGVVSAPAVAEVPDIEVDKLVLDGKKLDYRVEDAITGGTLERTIEGASTLTFTVHDEGPERELLNSGIFTHGVELELDDLHFTLVKISKQGDSLELTFEDREVNWLRRYTEPRRAYRERTTRAEFVLSLIREVKEGRVGYFIPELHVKQRIARIEQERDRPTRRQRDEERRPGLAAGVTLKIKGVKADREQLSQLERALSVAANLKASARVILAMLCSGIGESGFSAIPNAAGSGYAGVFQADPDNVPMNDTEQQARCFLLGGKGFQAGGAIALAKSNPGLSPGTIATMVEASGEPGSFYDAYRSEAEAILAAFSGGDLAAGGGGGPRTIIKRYAFMRGDQGKRESSWACIQRLAVEVGWRAFMVRGKLYFVSEEWLFASRPRMTISEESPGVHWIDFDFDSGKDTSELTVSCRAKRWAAPPGSVVAVEKMGAANGRWLVKQIGRSIYDRDTQITLGKPIPAKPEPAPQTKEVGGGPASSSSSSSEEGDTSTPRLGGGGWKVEGGSAYDKVYATAVAISEKNYPYVYGGGHGGTGAPSNGGYDCSSYASACLIAAGLLDTVLTSGGLMGWGLPGPGKHFTVFANSGHVFMHFYGREHKRADTGGGPPDGPHVRSSHRDHSGFVARHAEGH